MNERDDLERTLEAMGAASVPGPDADFVRSLEVQLSALDAGTNVSPLVRRTRRVGAVGIAAATLAFAGVAAAAGVAITRPFRDDPPAVTTTVALPSSTTVLSTTTVVTTTASTVPEVTVAPTPPPTSVAPTVPPTTVPVIVPPTEPPRTSPPPTEPIATTTTEVRTPATITVTCGVVDATQVRCTWTAGPDGTARYEVLRSTPGAATGRAYEVGLDAGNTWLDPQAAPGTSGGYVVWAVDAAGTGIAHSQFVTVSCC